MATVQSDSERTKDPRRQWYPISHTITWCDGPVWRCRTCAAIVHILYDAAKHGYVHYYWVYRIKIRLKAKCYAILAYSVVDEHIIEGARACDVESRVVMVTELTVHVVPKVVEIFWHLLSWKRLHFLTQGSLCGSTMYYAHVNKMFVASAVTDSGSMKPSHGLTNISVSYTRRHNNFSPDNNAGIQFVYKKPSEQLHYLNA